MIRMVMVVAVMMMMKMMSTLMEMTHACRDGDRNVEREKRIKSTHPASCSNVSASDNISVASITRICVSLAYICPADASLIPSFDSFSKQYTASWYSPSFSHLVETLNSTSSLVDARASLRTGNSSIASSSSHPSKSVQSPRSASSTDRDAEAASSGLPANVYSLLTRAAHSSLRFDLHDPQFTVQGLLFRVLGSGFKNSSSVAPKLGPRLSISWS